MSRHPLHFSVLLAVAIGGAVGASGRYGLGEVFPSGSDGFPWTTFAIYVSGSFLLALLPAFATVVDHPLIPPALGTGLLGGYTTLSTYSEQSRHLIDAGHAGTAVTYLVGTLVACILAVAIADRFSTVARRTQFEDEEGDL
jgi:CrcB protein